MPYNLSKTMRDNFNFKYSGTLSNQPRITLTMLLSLLCVAITMGDNKTTDAHNTTTRGMCRRATSIYIDISVHKRHKQTYI
jgi:hypothetical protein